MTILFNFLLQLYASALAQLSSALAGTLLSRVEQKALGFYVAQISGHKNWAKNLPHHPPVGVTTTSLEEARLSSVTMTRICVQKISLDLVAGREGHFFNIMVCVSKTGIT